MRIVTVRGWSKEYKKMWESPTVNFATSELLMNDGEWYVVDKLLMPTGLKDRHGKEIYEGDIVARYWSDGSVLQQFEVKWFDDKAGYQITPALLESTRHNQQTGMTAHGFEVIGNIYENPELLNG